MAGISTTIAQQAMRDQKDFTHVLTDFGCEIQKEMRTVWANLKPSMVQASTPEGFRLDMLESELESHLHFHPASVEGTAKIVSSIKDEEAFSVLEHRAVVTKTSAKMKKHQMGQDKRQP